MTQPASTDHVCHGGKWDNEEKQFVCEHMSTDLDAQLEEILKAYKRYPYGTEDSPHITGDDAKQALTKLIADREREALEQMPHGLYQAHRYDTDDEVVLHLWADGKSYDIRAKKDGDAA